VMHLDDDVRAHRMLTNRSFVNCNLFVKSIRFRMYMMNASYFFIENDFVVHCSVLTCDPSGRRRPGKVDLEKKEKKERR